MPTEEVHQYTIRGIPAEVDEALRKQARAQGISLNQLVVERLQASVLDSKGKKKRNLDFLHGAWLNDPEFDAALEEQPAD